MAASSPDSVISSIEARLQASMRRITEKCEPLNIMIGTTVNAYAKGDQVSRGSFWTIYKAVHKETKKPFFIKRVSSDDEDGTVGVPIELYQEIDLLRRLKHKNIQALVDIVYSNNLMYTFLVLEYAEDDLAQVIADIKIPFSQAEMKCILRQLFSGLERIHEVIIHRDIIPSNILIDNFGVLKISNFDAAKKCTGPLTPTTGTLRYKAPELLFLFPTYNAAVDIWAAGCIFGELMKRSPLFPGNCPLQQVDLIIDLLGTPNYRMMKGLSSIPDTHHVELKVQPYNFITRTFKDMISSSGIDFLKRLLVYEPSVRPTATECLAHEYFAESPLACMPNVLKLGILQKKNIDVEDDDDDDDDDASFLEALRIQ